MSKITCVLIHYDIKLRSLVLAQLTSIPDVMLLNVITNDDELSYFLSQADAPDFYMLSLSIDSLMAFEKFRNLEIDTPLIIISSNAEYAFEAFELSILGFLKEPLDQNELLKILAKIKPNLTKFKATDRFKERFLVKIGDKLISKNADDICCFYAEGRYVYLVSKDEKRRYLIDYTLDQLEQSLLDPAKFFRINRKYILHVSTIEEVKKYYNRRLIVYMNGPVYNDLVVSRERVGQFKRWIDA